MKVNYKQIIYFLICAILMFLPRRWFILGIQSYRLVILILLCMTAKKWSLSRAFFNVFTIAYLMFVTIYYFVDSGFLSAIGFAIDTAGLFVLIYSNVNTKSDLQSLLKVFCNCTTLYSFLCIIQTFTEFNIFDLFAESSLSSATNYYRFGLVRSYGSFNTSINNALFLVMASCVILYLIENESNVKEHKKYIFSYVICIFAVCACMSRGPLLLLLFTIILYLIKKGLFKFIYRNIIKISATLIVVVILFSVIKPFRVVLENFINMYLAIFDEETSQSISTSFGVNPGGVGERLLLYNWVGEKIVDHEMLGLGPSSVPEFNYIDEWNKLRTKRSLENHYLKMVYNFGYIGLALFVLFTIKMLMRVYKLYKYYDLHNISFYYMAFVAELIYIICIFIVASVDDMRMYYFIICITELLYGRFYKYEEEQKVLVG